MTFHDNQCSFSIAIAVGSSMGNHVCSCHPGSRTDLTQHTHTYMAAAAAKQLQGKHIAQTRQQIPYCNNNNNNNNNSSTNSNNNNSSSNNNGARKGAGGRHTPPPPHKGPKAADVPPGPTRTSWPCPTSSPGCALLRHLPGSGTAARRTSRCAALAPSSSASPTTRTASAGRPS